MAANSRTKNAFLNFISSIGGQLITIVMQFVVRTVFIRTLGKSYLGINGLFTNILSMLSLAEMGVGSAIIFKLYEPLAKKDEKRIRVLMDFYRVVYQYIGAAVALLGLCLIPFLPKLINDYEKLASLNLNAVLIYCIYLFDSVSSYFFFAYKSAIVKADQKEYYINLISYLFTIGAGLVQIICMVVFRNFLTYTLITVVKTISQNLVIALFANRTYPYIKEKSDQTIDREEAKGIFKDCGALFIYKVNNVVVKSMDNIILSAYLGLDSVAMYSNYYIFYTTIRTLFTKVFNSVGHSIGNLHALNRPKREYEVFESTMLISAVLGGTAMVGLFAVADEFIRIWIGESWVLVQPFAFLTGMELYTSSMKQALAKYRTSYGLFRQGWARPLVGMIINLLVSILLVQKMGISGVLIGTIVSDWATCVWYDPLILHKYGFQNKFPVAVYFLKFAEYFITTLAVGAADYFICTHVLTGLGWFSVIIHALICGTTVPAALLLITYRTQEGQYLIKMLRNITRKILKK